MIAAMTSCALVTDNSSNMDALKSTRVHAENGLATFGATNTFEWAKASFPCAGDGHFTADTQFLLGKVKTIKSEADVAISVSEKSISIVSGRSKWTVPTFAEIVPENDFEMPEPLTFGADFLAAIDWVSGAAEVNGNRPYLNGVYVAEGVAVGTDGHELREMKFDGKIEASVILPLTFIRKCKSTFAGPIEFSHNDRMVMVSANGISLRSTLVDGAYPDYRRIIDGNRSNMTGTLSVDCDEFIEALTRACAIGKSGEKAGAYINTQLQFRDGEILVYTRNSAGEEGFSECGCARNEGEDYDVGIKGECVLDIVKSMDCDRMIVHYGSSNLPVFFENGDKMALRMPTVFK